MAESKKRIIYVIAAVICIIIGVMLKQEENAEQGALSTETIQTTEKVQASETLTAEKESTAEPLPEDYVEYYFRNDDLLEQHYKKHGMEMGFESMEAYEEAASAVVYHPDVLSKTEAEDGDYVYYIEETNEFVVISQDGYIRTYFNPSAGIDYYNRQ